MGGSRAPHRGKLALHFPAGCYDSEQIQEILGLFLGNTIQYLTLLLFPSFPNGCYTNTGACAVVSERCLPSTLPNSQRPYQGSWLALLRPKHVLAGGVFCCNHSFLSVFKLNSSRPSVGGRRGFYKSRHSSSAAAKLAVTLSWFWLG